MAANLQSTSSAMAAGNQAMSGLMAAAGLHANGLNNSGFGSTSLAATGNLGLGVGTTPFGLIGGYMG